MKPWQSVLIGAAAALVFSVLYLSGIFSSVDERIYDLFLRFRAEREHIDNVVFLDVDDEAIAYNGVFPWPRSVTADGLLKLREYNALAAIFDIEFIDRGPQGVDDIYLKEGLPADFTESFSVISENVSDLLGAVNSGRLGRQEGAAAAEELYSLIREERDSLFTRAKEVARDNDEYLARSSAVFGRSWASLNLRAGTLSGEQAERRPMAEELFSYPVKAASGAHPGSFVDILPALPSFARSAQGAGFTNVQIDGDGVRRRIFLSQRIGDHWYLQLAFAPLIYHLGSPDLELYSRKMVVKNAHIPEGNFPGAGETKDIVIPLDRRGLMMLDWPSTNYFESFIHVSFARFSELQNNEDQMNMYCRGLGASFPFFAQFDPALAAVFPALFRIERNLDALREAKALALAEGSGEVFDEYIRLRRENRDLVREFLAADVGTKVKALVAPLVESNPASAEAIADEGEYIAALTASLAAALDAYEGLESAVKGLFENRFCILGRVDTGTTDMGVNPFYGEYINVGTHAVVLDTILSGSFIVPLSPLWSAALALLVPLFFLATFSMSPAKRTAFGFAGTLALILAPVLLFRFSGLFLDPLSPALAMVSAVIVREIISYRTSEREKVFYRRAFATYTSEAVAAEIARNPSLFQLGGAKREMSAIFTDIRGFSTISEKLSPEDLVKLLNRYLTAMSDVILAQDGTIDKYEGDAIIAFFGAPQPQADHALRACVSALRMKNAETELNQVIQEQGLSPAPLLTRIGINTGSMVAGNMGTDKKMNYTIMGDAVNLAARLEGVNKQYGTWILASEDTVKETGDSLLTRRLDRVRVVGKSDAVRLYNILNLAEEAAAEQKNLVGLFNEAMNRFEARNWKEAAEAFREVQTLEEGGPASLYLKRCEKFLAEAPDENWDGIFNLTEK